MSRHTNHVDCERHVCCAGWIKSGPWARLAHPPKYCRPEEKLIFNLNNHEGTSREDGTVVLVTNAEIGWIKLSCQKFLPTLAPLLENVKLVSARTTFEGTQCRSPLDWELRAFVQ